MRLRRGIYPTDSLITGIGSIDCAIDRLSRVLRRTASLSTSLSSNFDLVVCGYPRSGNSFLAASFVAASNGALHIGERQHDPLVVLAARRTDTPVVIPIRNPKDTVASWMVFRGASPRVSEARDFLKSYVRWHHFVDRYRSPLDSFIFDFDVFTETPEVVAEVPEVQRCLGKPLSPEIVESTKVLAQLVDKEQRERGDYLVTTASVPMEGRVEIMDQMRRLLGDSRLTYDLHNAEAVYEEFRAQAIVGP